MSAATEAAAPAGAPRDAGVPVSLPWLDEPKFRCFGCSPRNRIGLALRMARFADGSFGADVTFGEDYASYPGIVHGGVVSAAVDEVMGDLLALERGALAFSLTLRTKFLRPLLVGRPYRVVARIAREGTGLVHTEADVTSAAGEPHVMATATYQQIRSAVALEVMGLDGEEYERLGHYFDHEMGPR